MSKRSQQQDAIRQLISSLESPATAKDIMKLAGEKVPGIALATVYRCLGRLIEAGEARKIEIPGRPPHYESALQAHHHFFVCDDCEKVFALHNCSGGFQKIIPAGFEMKSHEVLVFGSCKGCVANAG